MGLGKSVLEARKHTEARNTPRTELLIASLIPRKQVPNLIFPVLPCACLRNRLAKPVIQQSRCIRYVLGTDSTVRPRLSTARSRWNSFVRLEDLKKLLRFYS